jgi:hypothetical protein
MTEQWFQFIAYNSQAHYGFGFEEEANQYLGLLNEGREINHYYYEPMSADETISLDSGDDTDGFRLEDAIATRLENREWNLAEKRMHALNLKDMHEAITENREWE